MTEMELLTQQVAQLRHEIDRMKAVNEIQNIMGRYEILLTGRTMDRVADEVFAMWMPDVSMEVSGNGVFSGPEAVRWMFEDMLGPKEGAEAETAYQGALFIHHVDTPVIQVAEDGQTAHCTFFSVGLESPQDPKTGKRRSQWCFGKYSAEFIKGECGWRIWHLHWFRSFLQDYYKGWTESYEEESPINVAVGTKPVKVLPTTYHQPYHPHKEMLPVPCCPDPYTTHVDSSWVLGPWAKKEQGEG